MRGKDARVVERASAYLQIHECLTISVITVAEVIKGFERLQRESEVARFMANIRMMDVLSLTVDAAIIAGRIYGTLERSGLPIGRMDPLVAAIALNNNLQLVTGNVTHYDRLRPLGFDLRISNWREQFSQIFQSLTYWKIFQSLCLLATTISVASQAKLRPVKTTFPRKDRVPSQP